MNPYDFPTYKRADLLFTDLERLKNISSKAGLLQVVYVGKEGIN